MPSSRSARGRRGRGLDDGRDVRGLPAGVRGGLVQEVVAVLGPRLVRVLGAEDHPGLDRGQQREAALETLLGRELVVVLLELRDRRRGVERQAQAHRAPDRRLGGAADHDRRVRVGERLRGDPDGRAAVLERLAGPRLEQRLQHLVLDLAAPLPLLAEGRVLLRAVAQTRDDGEPAAADVVQHRDVLGEPDRVVQRCEQRADDHADPLRGAEYRACGAQRRGAPRVVRAVVLLQADHVEPVLVREGRHLDGGLVAGGHLLPVETGEDLVEPQIRDSHGA